MFFPTVSSLFGFALSTAHAEVDGIFLNVGVEGGGSLVFDDRVDFGGHVAGRFSFVLIDWLSEVKYFGPTEWIGGYGRFEHNTNGFRGVLGLGHSTDVRFIGVEYGVVLAPGKTQTVAYGAEAATFLTFGLGALYIRESVLVDEQAVWQTDIGLRLQFPIPLKE